MGRNVGNGVPSEEVSQGKNRIRDAPLGRRCRFQKVILQDRRHEDLRGITGTGCDALPVGDEPFREERLSLLAVCRTS
jgi:hypothetical protein